MRSRSKVVSAVNSRNLGVPYHRTILAVDIERSTAQTNSAKAALRQAMYDVLEATLLASGVSEQCRDAFIDRGDGILVLIRPVDDVPKTLLLDAVIPTLCGLLWEHRAAHPNQSLRLRAVLHAGEVHYDRRGCFGEALDIAFRLLDAPKIKSYFRTIDEPLVLVVSDDIHRSVIRHGYDGIDERSFGPAICVRVAGKQNHGWVHVPKAIARR